MKAKTIQLTLTQHMRITLMLATAILLAATKTQAQQVTAATPFYKPGDTIRLSITFDGADLDDIASAQARLQFQGESSMEQKGFQSNIDGGESKRTSPNTFVVELKVPELISDGKYRLEFIWINFKGQRPPAYYQRNTHEIPDLDFQIRNPRHFENPRVKTITELH